MRWNFNSRKYFNIFFFPLFFFRPRFEWCVGECCGRHQYSGTVFEQWDRSNFVSFFFSVRYFNWFSSKVHLISSKQPFEHTFFLFLSMLPESPPDSGSERSSPPQIQEQSSQDMYSQSEDSFPPSCPFKDKKPEHCGGAGLMYDVGRTLGNHIKAVSPASVPQYCLNTAESYIQATTSHNAPIHGIPQYTQCSPMGLSGGHMPTNAAAASSCVPHAIHPETMYPYMPPKHDQHIG